MKTFEKTVKHRILDVLTSGLSVSCYWYASKLPDGYVTTGHICHPSIGGSSAPRRIREMRAAGIQIDIQTFKGVRKDGKPVHTWIYGLKTNPSEIDFRTGQLKSKMQRTAS